MRVIVRSFNELNFDESFVLPTKVQQRLSKKKNKQLFRQSHLAYCLLLKVLREEFSISNSEILFTDTGKPYLENGPYFSISHSGDYIAVAVSSREIGVDIEEISDFKESVADKYFSETEREYIFKGNKNINFFKLWTAKEAIIKKQGITMKELSKLELIPTFNGFLHENTRVITKTTENYVISVSFDEKTDF